MRRFPRSGARLSGNCSKPMNDPSYQAVEELCDEIQRLTAVIKEQWAEIAQLKAILKETDDEKSLSGLLTEE